jgi:hypothetical protein
VDIWFFCEYSISGCRKKRTTILLRRARYGGKKESEKESEKIQCVQAMRETNGKVQLLVKSF